MADEEFWEVTAVLAEKGDRYRVRWAGVDPTTGKPWPPSWVGKECCTQALIDDWNRTKEMKKRKKKSGQSKPGRLAVLSCSFVPCSRECVFVGSSCIDYLFQAFNTVERDTICFSSRRGRHV